MAAIPATAVVPTHSNSLGTDRLTAKTTRPKIGRDWQAAPTDAAPAPDGQCGDAFLALIDETRIGLGWSHKQMAINAAVDPGVWSEAMKGKPGRNFSVPWLDAQPIAYRIAFAKLVAKKFGVSRETERAIVLRRLFDAVESLVLLTEVSE